MNEPLVSVIIPIYNVDRYLEETIESVLQQTYTNWEILLVNDGSTDESEKIALAYAKAHQDKIRCLQHPGGVNKGLPASRNLAIAHAKGDYLALLDADDYWLPGKLAHQINITNRFPEVAMICGASLYWYSWEDETKDDVVIQVGGPKDQVLRPPLASVTLYPLGKGAAPCPCSIMIKRAVAEHYHGFEEKFRGKYQLYEDQAFFAKIYLHEPVFISSGVMDRYRQRSDSIMSQGAIENNYREVRLFFLTWLQEYMDREKINNHEVRKKLRAALFPYKHPLWYKIKSKITDR